MNYAALVESKLAQFEIERHGTEWLLYGTGADARFDSRTDAARERGVYAIRDALRELGVLDTLDAEIDVRRCQTPGSPAALGKIIRSYHLS